MAGYDPQQTVEDMKSLHGPSHNPCPLCGSSEATIASETSYAEIWSELHDEWRALISDVVKAAHTREPWVRLEDCSKCHLRYFSPATPGSAQFYSEVISSCPHYYTDHKLEFDYVKSLPRLKKKSNIVGRTC